MAKKTTKTTVKHTKKGTVTKTITKKSKKGLIIGIVAGALAIAAGAGVGIYFLIKNMNNGESNDVNFSVDKTTITLDDSLKDTLNLDWKPSDHSIECSDFTFTLKKQTDITARVAMGEVGSRPLKLTITFDKALSNEDEGELKFKYNDKTTGKKNVEGKVKGISVKMQDTPEPEKASFSLAGGSETYGYLADDEETTSVDIAGNIGKDKFSVDFYPNDGYGGSDFEVTIGDGKKFTAEYIKPTADDQPGTIELAAVGTHVLADGDELEATLELNEMEYPYFALENVFGENTNLSLKKYPGTEAATYTADVDYAYESEKVGERLTWHNWDYNTNDTITIKKGDMVYFKGNNPNGFNRYGSGTTEILSFNNSTVGVAIKAHGNIMSLIDDGACNTLIIPNDYCFATLFNVCTGIDLDEDFELPATTLKNYCYHSMFAGCYSLTHAPKLPATVIESGCYNGMFQGCKQLTSAPEISVTTVNNGLSEAENGGKHFSSMFSGTAITEIPDLSKITSFTGKRQSQTFACMFQECDSITSVEKDKIPNITTICNQQFDAMFYGCDNLESVDLSNIVPDDIEYSRYSFRDTFKGCTKLNYVKVGFGTAGEDTWPMYEVDPSAGTTEPITPGWFDAIDQDHPMQTSGTFVWNGKAGEPTTWERGPTYVLNGWTIQNPQP